MDGVGVQVEGLNELIRTMKRAEVDITELKDAHHDAGMIVAAYAQAIAPRRSGRLAASIRSTKQVRRARIQAGRASVPYAGPIHWGWPARHIQAQPFLTDAAQATESTWLPVYLQAVDTALAQIRGT
jgi:uncharacterized protein YcsI (UPF0317 family)